MVGVDGSREGVSRSEPLLTHGGAPREALAVAASPTAERAFGNNGDLGGSYSTTSGPHALRYDSLMSQLQSINPTTDEIIGTYETHGEKEIEARLTTAETAFQAWRMSPFGERRARLAETSRVLSQRQDELAELMTLEMGKPIVEAEAEIEKCGWVCEYYAENGEQFLTPEPATSDGSEAFVRFDPLGPILAVMPWNFPFWQVFRFAAPALMAGNVGLLKHASNVPGCALAIEQVFAQAGYPEGAFSTLLIGSEAVERVIADQRVAAVTLTGSEPAGRAVAAAAGSHLKKTVLELGGSDPFIVLADADPVAVAKAAAFSRCLNAGQSCIAAKRFIVEEAVADRFEEALKKAMLELRLGPPTDRRMRIGPLARRDLRDELHDQVERSVAAGARLICGGLPHNGAGCFYHATVLVDVEPGNPAFEEELFGPVAAVIRARDAEHAVELANRSSFGLGASIWTGDPERGKALAPQIEAGAVFVNGIVKSDPRLPFGGIKSSGYGRELGAFGIREFVNVKTVWIA
jgi:succinate-semialdehyde dehydrogenase/glutarate-semialdehyde dehydrogenase